MRDVDGNVDRMRVDLDHLPELLEALDTTARPKDREQLGMAPSGLAEAAAPEWSQPARSVPATGARQADQPALPSARSAAAAGWTRSAQRVPAASAEAAGWTRPAATAPDGAAPDRAAPDGAAPDGAALLAAPAQAEASGTIDLRDGIRADGQHGVGSEPDDVHTGGTSGDSGADGQGVHVA
jgi:hypothetical protein